MCRLSEERSSSSSKAEVIGGETLIGMISSFIDNLKLSYHEVFEEIPFRVLLLMQKDKQRVTTGDIVKQDSGKDMASRRRKRK